MKFIRFSLAKEDIVRNGTMEEDKIYEFTGDLFINRQSTGNVYEREKVQLKAPIVPNHIIGIGKNFAPQGTEKPPVPEMPILFFKPLKDYNWPQQQGYGYG
ncbi:DUF2437 domain-containing protein [Paenibacillus filicis]|uniref:DUF2437 domain-containing protein n=1 Tax=Paenibacillus gyeongsangnamensis TaxID=3388067 RepID=A0ABT4Q4A2_9BACL|nr:DUF2437 domain-containing protein [Paenibacillus filicis]MCZ8511612.1 DUF2437 domain-containing protein [Paenibacillus filicis]